MVINKLNHLLTILTMNQQQITELTTKCHEAAKANGWHEQTRTETEIILLIKSEMFEAFEAYRKQRYAKINNFMAWMEEPNASPSFKGGFETFIKDTFEDELADTAIRIFDAAGLYDLHLHYREPKNTLHDFSFIDGLKEFDGFSSKIRTIAASNLSYLLLIVNEIALNMNIDILRHIDLKLEYNKTRGKRHGNKIL